MLLDIFFFISLLLHIFQCTEDQLSDQLSEIAEHDKISVGGIRAISKAKLLASGIFKQEIERCLINTR